MSPATAPSFARMAELIRAGRDDEAEREFNALVVAVIRDATTVRFQHPAFGDGDVEMVVAEIKDSFGPVAKRLRGRFL